MPGPEEQANTYYCWGHGTAAEGLVGILTIGRVLRSSAAAVQVAPYDDVFSFYGKATQDIHYEPSKLDFISKLHHSTTNSAGVVTVVVGIFWGLPTTKASRPARSVRATCASFILVRSPSGDKRWAIREVAGRIDRIWVLSSTHSAQLAVEKSSDSQARRPVTFDSGDGNDWGVSWPGIEDAVREPRALHPSEVKREL